MTAVCGVIMVATMWISSHAAHRFDNAEISAAASKNGKGEKLRICDILSAVKGNKALFCRMIAYSTNAFANKFVTSNQQYYAKYYLEDMKFISLTGTISTVLTVPMFLLVLWLSRRISKRNIFLYATILHLIFPVLMLCGFSRNFYVMVASMALSQITALMCTMCMQIMLPDCVDYGYRISGVVAVGYVPNVTQTAEVLTAIILLLTTLTIFSDICSIIGMRLYPIKSVDKKKQNKKYKEKMMNKTDITGAIDRRSEWLFGLSDAIWDHPELAFHETYAVNLLCDALRKEGFTVEERLAGISTAFSGRFGEGKPVIGILGEYDALAGMSQKADVTHAEPIVPGGNGHGCGHNLLGVGSLAAAIAVKDYLQENKLSGTVIYFGCPAEEGGSGKAFMARAGVFDELGLPNFPDADLYHVR